MAVLAKILGQVPGDIDKVYGVDTSTISKVHGVDWPTITLPSGIIVPLRGAGAVPAGWSIYNSADGKQIVGAGSTYAVDDNGAGSGNINLSHTGGGAHLDVANYYFGSNPGYCGFTTDPNHTHTTMTFAGPAPYYTESRLIKAGSEQDSLPEDAVVFKHSPDGWVGLTRAAPGIDRHFKANTADGTGGLVINAVAASSNNAHDHDGSRGVRPGGDGNRAYGAQVAMQGTHTHSFAASLSFNLYRVYMSMWYSNAGAYELDGVGFIGMYESLTPPAGWALCNGGNGTPDMRDSFVLAPAADANAGVFGGTGKVTCTTVTDSQGAHTHIDTSRCNGCPRILAHHGNTIGAHTHTCNHNATWLPPYYALAFIMYTG